MNSLPTINLRAEGGGWTATCSCGWEKWDRLRPTLDREAVKHRAGHQRGGVAS